MIIITNNVGDNLLFARDNNQSLLRSIKFEKGRHIIQIEMKTKMLPGNFNITAGIIYTKQGNTIDWVENVYSYKVVSKGYESQDDYPYYTVHGFAEPETIWKYEKIN